MNNNIKVIIISIIYIIFDVIWISSNIKMYNNNTIRIQGKISNITYNTIIYIIICYGLLLLSIIHIAIPLTLNNIKEKDTLEDKIYKSIQYGGSVGFCIYGIYNLISLIIYENFEIILAIIDTIWGTFIYSLLTLIYLLLK
jgi:uncharacterized membrane protein